MKCPFCKSSDLKVIDKRDVSDLLIRRRRECNNCHRRFTTYERITELELVVVKRNGVKEKFNKEKLRQGLILACKKRPVTLQQIDNIVQGIEQELRSKGILEVKSEDIGNMVLERLRQLDEVAYVRYASIFKNFESIADFRAALKDLEGT